MPACCNTTKDFSSVITGGDGPGYSRGVYAHIIEDAVKVLCTTFESSGTSTFRFVATEG